MKKKVKLPGWEVTDVELGYTSIVIFVLCFRSCMQWKKVATKAIWL